MAGNKMAEKSRELGKFGFGIKIVRRSDGSVGYETQSVNEGVPIEIVIMQLRAFLKKLEKNYFSGPGD